MPIKRITKRAVEGMAPDPTRDVYLRDDRVKGFFAKLTPRGSLSYSYEYKNAARKTRRIFLGVHGELTPEQARSKAQRFANIKRAGDDPARPRTERRKAKTVNEVADRWLQQAAIDCKPQTVRDYDGWVDREIRPRLGDYKITDVEIEDIEKLRAELLDKKVTFNRAHACLSALFNYAIRKHWVKGNPCQGVEKLEEKPRVRKFEDDDLKRLKVVLDKAEARGDCPAGVDAIKLLQITGCRLNEIVQLKWAHVNFSKGLLELPDSKTGEKEVALGTVAINALTRIQLRQVTTGYYDSKNGFVCRGPSGSPVTSLPKWWRRWRAEANLDGATLHMFRHTFATRAANHGIPIHTLKGMLGHKNISMTEKYSNASKETEREAADVVADLFGKNGSLLAGE